MTDLAHVSGLDIQWAADGTLQFGPDIVVDETFSRPRARLSAVALDPGACIPADETQYWMYNGIATRDARERLAATGLRYELTLMFPRALGRERAKTLGHLHNFPEGSPLNYPEIIEVVHGRAFFIFQTMHTEKRIAPFCAVLEALSGDKVVIPPNLHHLTINAGDGPLLFSDVIPLATKGIYQPLADMHGAAYLFTTDNQWLKNPSYRSVGELQRWTTREYPARGLTRDKPLFRAFMEAPTRFDWLLHPEQFQTVFPDIWQTVESVIKL
jgi:glucose-6-phosphate isomerase